MHSIFYFCKILGFNFLAFQRNAQPSLQVMISGVWGHVTNKHQTGITGTKFLPGRHLLRKDALLANLLSSEKRSIMFVGGATMDYITTKEAAANWGISDRRVLQYCNADRIEGAIKIGHIWLIPKSIEKPIDRRYKKRGNSDDTDCSM